MFYRNVFYQNLNFQRWSYPYPIHQFEFSNNYDDGIFAKLYYIYFFLPNNIY